MSQLNELDAELRRRFGGLYSPQELVWQGDWVVGLDGCDPEVARVVVASSAARLERMAVGCSLDDPFGFAEDFTHETVIPLDELLASAPFATTVHAAAETIAIASHDRLETLSLVTRTWPLAGAAFPALQRLELVITETPVTGPELAAALRACPRLTELVVRGAGFAGVVAELGALPYPSGLALVVDVAIDVATALALAAAPGSLAALSRLELQTKSPAAHVALLGLEQAIPLATRGDRLANVVRWPVVEAGCSGPIDPALRVWEWRTGDEGRSQTYIAFLPNRLDEALSPREAELVRLCEANEPHARDVYADWLEQTGALERSLAIRSAGLPFRPRTLPEAMAILACAWQRITRSHWGWTLSLGPVVELWPEAFAEYLTHFVADEHPLAPDPSRAITPDHFDERARGLLEMMREAPPATLLENHVLVRPDVATFTPPIGTVRAALQLRDAWNDVVYGAETTLGYALLVWHTGA